MISETELNEKRTTPCTVLQCGVPFGPYRYSYMDYYGIFGRKVDCK